MHAADLSNQIYLYLLQNDISYFTTVDKILKFMEQVPRARSRTFYQTLYRSYFSRFSLLRNVQE